ncbi:MAG: hypothetical protein ACRD3T_12350 [Terriglobia bacterium]
MPYPFGAFPELDGGYGKPYPYTVGKSQGDSMRGKSVAALGMGIGALAGLSTVIAGRRIVPHP